MAESLSKGGTEGDPDRDEKGYFRKGHSKPGPGNPHLRRLSAWQRSLRRAVTPAALERVLKKLVAMAEAGDNVAIRLLLDRTVAPADRVEMGNVQLPAPVDAASTAAAATALMQAVADGRLSPEAAAKLGGLVELSRKAIELEKFETLAREIEELKAKANK